MVVDTDGVVIALMWVAAVTVCIVIVEIRLSRLEKKIADACPAEREAAGSNPAPNPRSQNL
jgi:hypothetical protein